MPCEGERHVAPRRAHALEGITHRAHARGKAAHLCFFGFLVVHFGRAGSLCKSLKGRISNAVDLVQGLPMAQDHIGCELNGKNLGEGRASHHLGSHQRGLEHHKRNALPLENPHQCKVQCLVRRDIKDAQRGLRLT